jgi:hypothetical protein
MPLAARRSKTAPGRASSQHGNHYDDEPTEDERCRVQRRRENTTMRPSQREHCEDDHCCRDNKRDNENGDSTENTHLSAA